MIKINSENPEFINPRRLRKSYRCEDGCSISVDIHGSYKCRNCSTWFPRKKKILLEEMLKSTTKEHAESWLKALKRGRRKVLKGDLSGMTWYNTTDEFGSTDDGFYDETL